MRFEVRRCQLKADQLCVALKFFGKTLAIAKIVCYKRINFGKSPSLANFFYQRQLSLPIQTLMALSNEIGGQGTSGRLHLAGKGRHWPPQKTPAAPGHESLDGRIRSREGGSDPSVVGALMGAR